MRIIDNDLLSMQEARILVENARDAQKKLATFPQQKLDEIVNHMIDEIEKHSLELAKLSYEETDYGKWQDKYTKNHFVCTYLRKRLEGMSCVGIIKEDIDSKTMDIGVPLGVLVALSPATSPVSTTIYKTLIAVKSGNAILFSPHPRAKMVMAKTLDILIHAAEESGLPEGAVSYLHTVTLGGTRELMHHKDVALIMNTGVPAMLKECYGAGKPIIYGGMGNGPAFIERTADIQQAVKDIIDSKTFDFGIVSAAEQSVVVDSCIAAEVKQEFIHHNAYFMSEEESKRLGSLFFMEDGSVNAAMVGKSPQFLAKQAGFSVNDSIRVLVSEERYVSDTNPYAKEKFAPVLAYYIEDDWMHACEKCIELLLNERQGHTLVIHSKDEDVIKQFALKKPVGRMLVNTPAVFGSMGATTNLFPAMTLGSGSAGEGMTSDNVSPMNLLYIRKVGYGVRKTEDIVVEVSQEEYKPVQEVKNTAEFTENDVAFLQRLLKRILEEM